MTQTRSEAIREHAPEVWQSIHHGHDLPKLKSHILQGALLLLRFHGYIRKKEGEFIVTERGKAHAAEHGFVLFP